MKKTESKRKNEKSKALAKATEDYDKCNDYNCHIHGRLKTRGRTFEGKVTKKFPKRIVIEFERMIYVRKYERYAKSKTKIHARLPVCMENKINIGDIAKIKECRPLSKIIHFTVIDKIKDKENIKENI